MDLRVSVESSLSSNMSLSVVLTFDEQDSNDLLEMIVSIKSSFFTGLMEV